LLRWRGLLRRRVLLLRRGLRGCLLRGDLLGRSCLLRRGVLRGRRLSRCGLRRVLLRWGGLRRRRVLLRRRRGVLRRRDLGGCRRRQVLLRRRSLRRRTPLLRGLLPSQRQRGNQKTQDTTEPTLHRCLHASGAPLVPPGNPPGPRMILGQAFLFQPARGGRPPARQEIRHSQRWFVAAGTPRRPHAGVNRV